MINVSGTQGSPLWQIIEITLKFSYDAWNYFLVVPLSSLKIILEKNSYSNQGEDKLFVSINDYSCLVLLLIFINFREAQEREGFLVTVEQRACEEIL